MKHKSKIAIFMTLAIFLAQAIPLYANDTIANTIVVNGSASIKVAPDTAVISLGVTTKDENAKKAQEENAETMLSVLALLENLGIESKDIETSYYAIYPDYSYSTDGSSKVIGYTVYNALSVTVRDLDLISDVLDQGVAAGVNTGGDINFTVANTDAYYNQALVKAIANGKEKADAIAGAIGVTVDTPINITESGSYYYPSVTQYREIAVQDDAEYDAAYATPITKNEIEITAQVQLVYGIK